jgi:multidrug resistance protein, MATE family
MATREKGHWREVLKLAWPLVISTASFSVMQFCDRVFLANYSGDALRAAVPASILSFTFVSGFRAVVAYANTFVAQYYGAGRKHDCALATMQAVILSFLLWPLILLSIPLGRAFLILADHPPAVLSGELEYFTITLLGGITNLLPLAAASFFIGRGRTFIMMAAIVIGNIVNILLDYILIFGKFGLPEMGIRGAAIGTVAAGLVTPLILLCVFFSKRCDREYGTRASIRLKPALMKRMIRFALPAGVHFALHIGSFAFFVVMVGRIGPTALAASNIVLSVNLFAFMPMVGLGLAAQTLLGQYVGSGDPKSGYRSVISALKIGAVYISCVGASFALFPAQYISLFTSDSPQTVSAGEVYGTVRILMLMLIARGFADMIDIVLSNALKGAGDTKFVMVFSLALAWTMLGGGEYLIIEVFGGGIYLAWSWAILYLIVMAIGYWLRFQSGRWRDIDLLGRRLAPPLATDPEAFVVTE